LLTPPLHESVRNKLMKQQRALVLGVADMTQAIAAVRALKSETDETLARVYETALVVSFMRPFSGKLRLPETYYEEPPSPDDAKLVADMKTLRDKVYAHTDKDTGRRASPITIRVEGELVHLSWNEAWVPLPRERLDAVIEICE
jgi:hypothetical protein